MLLGLLKCLIWSKRCPVSSSKQNWGHSLGRELLRQEHLVPRVHQGTWQEGVLQSWENITFPRQNGDDLLSKVYLYQFSVCWNSAFWTLRWNHLLFPLTWVHTDECCIRSLSFWVDGRLFGMRRIGNFLELIERVRRHSLQEFRINNV